MNLTDLFAIPLAARSRQVALRCPLAGGGFRELTFEELHTRAEKAAGALAARGLVPGDRIAFYLGNRPEFAIAYLAALRLGAAMVPINLAYRRREIAHLLGDARPRLLLAERSRQGVLDELEHEERAGVEVLWAEELEAAAASASAPVPAPLVDGSDLALLMYTSGTTGRSKGALLTHDNVMATVTALLAAWAWSAGDVLLLTLPLFHTHGLVVGLHCALAAGAAVELWPRFEAAAVAERLASGDATLFFGVPTLYVRLVEELRRRGDGRRLERLRLFCSGSAALAPGTFLAFEELTGHRILERYGMTETGMLLSNPYVPYAPYAPASGRQPGSVGTPLPGVSARVVDKHGADLPPGAEGELVVRGANVCAGYWQAPEKSAESFLTDASGRRWFRTGDLARRDPGSGSYTLLGRRHELIISGGFNVYPREIEEVLAAFPGVREAAVVGRPHPEWGEVAVAFLVCERAFSSEELTIYCKAQLASFKCPREFRFVDELPRNALGKVLKHQLPG